MSTTLKTRKKSGKLEAVLLLAVLVLLYLPALAGAKELQAGVSPLVLDLGTLNAGTSTSGSFFIVTSSQDEILVNLNSERSSLDFFRKPEYSEILRNVSEQDSSSWVFFPSNPYVLKHANESLKTAGGSISDWKKVSFILNVPKNAEPCSHAVRIRPAPYTAEEYGNAVNIVAVTALTVIFNVEGMCDTSGRILDIIQKEDSPGGNVEIDVYFQNTGTATISAHAPLIAVSLDNGTEIDAKPSGYGYVGPGKISILSADFDPKEFAQAENYVVNATVDYGANSASKKAILSIRQPKKIYLAAPALQSLPESRNSYLVLLILLIIIIAAYKVYKSA